MISIESNLKKCPIYLKYFKLHLNYFFNDLFFYFQDSELCIALASALHYIRLCVFSWMLLMTHNMYMQYKTGLHLVPVTDTNIGRNFVR